MATPSQTSVANSALRILGAKRVASIDAETRTALVLKDAWDDALEEVLRLHPWKFAFKRASLAALVATPEWGPSAAFQWPADCVAIREVDDPGKQGWRNEGRTIATNIGAPLKVRYTARIVDMSVWDSLGRKALSAQLAIECAETLTGTTAKVQEAYEIRADAMSKGRPVDGQQDSPRHYEPSEWDDARGESAPDRSPPDDTAEPL